MHFIERRCYRCFILVKCIKLNINNHLLLNTLQNAVNLNISQTTGRTRTPFFGVGEFQKFHLETKSIGPVEPLIPGNCASQLVFWLSFNRYGGF